MKSIFILSAFALSSALTAQTNPAITKWLINTTGIQGRHYVSGNSTPITDAVEANVQSVKYSATSVYVATNGIPAYITGPFLDGNPSLATSQNAIFKFPLTPTPNTGAGTPTTGGNIGIFINGVALFDYRDGVSWSTTSQTVCGGPIRTCTGNGVWNRDAVVAERGGFDCAKAHPANGNYHHHQNPSAFKLDLTVLSTVCSSYNSDGLYVIDATKHSPLLGFAYDGYPIYGAYGYTGTNGTGAITRMKSSYRTKSMTTRTNGPAVSTTYPLGYFKEDYEFVAGTTSDYLDVHNGRFCVTPEYPNGTYAYFCTVDANHNSAYPYVVGPTFYGVVSASKVTSITETTTTYNPVSGVEKSVDELAVNIYPNPANEYLFVQVGSIVEADASIALYDINGRLLQKSTIVQGSTIGHLDTRTYYEGHYILKVTSGKDTKTFNVLIAR